MSLSPWLGFAWRSAALAGVSAGLASSAWLGASADSGAAAIVAGLLAVGLGVSSPPGNEMGPATAKAWIWLALVVCVAAIAGVSLGTERLGAIDDGALSISPGRSLTVSGHVMAGARRRGGEVSVRAQTHLGRVLIRASEPVPELSIGTAIRATGTLREPSDFERGYLQRLGIGRILAARELEVGGPGRSGLSGLFDRVRARAEAALTSGTTAGAAALLRGFILGQDDRIDARTTESFKRSGLAHLLAVSGQNVLLLAILANVAMSIVGVPIRPRLLATVGLIGAYVVVTGAGPSILRAGIMGAASIAAALAGRPRSRWYAVLLALAGTLAIDPRACTDPGWQLSFAAVAGILVGAHPLREAIGGAAPGRVRRALAEAASVTIAATLATAPLMALHFQTLSIVSLPANLIAVVAEAPVMWLGMVAAALGQLPWIPVEPITWIAGVLAGYIGAVAEAFAAPGWAQVEVPIPSWAAIAAVYAVMIAGVALLTRAIRRRAGLAAQGRVALLLAAVLALALGAAAIAAAPTPPPSLQGRGLRVVVLDVGQGDAILLDPEPGAPILVDAGPPGTDISRRLDELTTEPLAALVLTHPDLDHAGGVDDILAAPGAGTFAYARATRGMRIAASAASADLARVSAGSRIVSGRLRLSVLWPPRDRLQTPVSEPNADSIVLLARWGDFRMLLTGDAEAETATIHPGAVDVLKVAHHASEDAGLASLLNEIAPEAALISVGDDNPFGHPTEETLATLAEAGIATLRTDLDGELTVIATRAGWRAETQSGER